MENHQKESQTHQIHLEVRLQGDSRRLEGGGFEVVAITSGVGNGWNFPASVLRQSLPLWDGVECFIDHRNNGRSLRDLAGVFSSPRWDEEHQGVVLDLKPVGPAGEMLRQLGDSLTSESAQPRVGFSADLVFTADDKTVNRILRVYSVDLVHNPARGGAFLRPIDQHTATAVQDAQLKEDDIVIKR